MGYYASKLSGARLRQCYAIAPPRVKRYLRAEIAYVRDRIMPRDRVLELGCGYGRVVFELAPAASKVVGIDTSTESLALARELTVPSTAPAFAAMDALALGFPDGVFEKVVCIQNGISAFGVDPLGLVREAMRVTVRGGRAFFSSYAERFWPHRLQWFELQARHGLVGEIDHARTGNGLIVCRDGFRAGAMAPADFEALCKRLGLTPFITEVDGSSVICELQAP